MSLAHTFTEKVQSDCALAIFVQTQKQTTNHKNKQTNDCFKYINLETRAANILINDLHQQFLKLKLLMINFVS